MTPAHNFHHLFHGHGPAWHPFTLDIGAFGGFTDPVLRRFQEETGKTDPGDYFGYDFRTFSVPATFGGDDPRALHDDSPEDATFDEWGIGHWAGGGEGTYERMYSPLARAETVPDVEALPTPVIDLYLDCSPIRRFHERGYPVCGYAGSVYEWSWWLRGMQQFMEDLVLAPALAEAVVEKVCGYTQELALATTRVGIDVLCFYDDAGMQSGMQLSPDLWRRFLKPAWAKVISEVKTTNPRAITFLHSCGNIREIVPDIVELGFDILHPVQPECMDFAEVRREFGKDLVLCATLSAQTVLPFGSPDDVRGEVQRLKAICEDGRTILCPSNRIQPETPWENIVAFAEECRGER